MSRLSPRQQQILQLAAEGRKNQAIAYELGIGLETVRHHVKNILGNLGAHNRTHAVAIALRAGWIQ